MKASISTEQRQHILRRLREATVYQIGLWDTATEIAEVLDCELNEILESITHLAITADTGMDLDSEDLQDLLNPGSTRTKVGRALADGMVQ